MASGFSWRRSVVDFSSILIGCALFAAGIDMFLVPNGLAAGGVSGLATITSHLASLRGVPLPVGIQTICINVLLMLLVARSGDNHYLVRVIVGFLASGMLIDAIEPLVPKMTDDMLLASIWGGAICGAGIGLVMRGGGNTGGTDIIAQYIQRHAGVPVGTTFIVSDFIVITLSALAFSPRNALYALVSIFISGRVCDAVVDGPRTMRAAYIISGEHAAIAERIMYRLNRGCTELQARGVWSGNERPVLMCVLGRAETARLKEIVAECDPEAIIFISEMHEAFGEGFKRMGR
ncbi:YitT family protein [Coriobacteriales bacterium OH1046]|nr:YitT family protein [Coriobacteriales bacterium OH1046]